MIILSILLLTFSVIIEATQNGNFIGPLWLPRNFKITCCRGGSAIAEDEKLVSNWTQRVVEYARGNEEKDDGCRLFEGSFLLSATALYNSSYTAGYGVKCKCPDTSIPLDNHCRQLAACQNGGYRSESLGGRCFCPSPYFGEFCQLFCDQGQMLAGTDGHKYCSCLPFYQGQECNRMVCLNGGIEVTNRCQCPQYFLGYHCEIDTNRTMHQTPRFTRYPENSDLFTRDISGTAFSLIMIILLIASLYLLLKHRLQNRVQQQMNNNNTRRAEHAVFCLRDDPLRRVSPFVSQGILAPPPYSTGNQSRTRNRQEELPPLPSYEDATKSAGSRPPPFSAQPPSTETPIQNADATAVASAGSSSSTTSATLHPPVIFSTSTSSDAPDCSRLSSVRRSL